MNVQELKQKADDMKAIAETDGLSWITRDPHHEILFKICEVQEVDIKRCLEQIESLRQKLDALEQRVTPR